jgi:hypothetical protein
MCFVALSKKEAVFALQTEVEQLPIQNDVFLKRVLMLHDNI